MVLHRLRRVLCFFYLLNYAVTCETIVSVPNHIPWVPHKKDFRQKMSLYYYFEFYLSRRTIYCFKNLAILTRDRIIGSKAIGHQTRWIQFNTTWTLSWEILTGNISKSTKFHCRHTTKRGNNSLFILVWRLQTRMFSSIVLCHTPFCDYILVDLVTKTVVSVLVNFGFHHGIWSEVLSKI